jgi:peptide/nickel transport system ATP-binding protein
MKGDVLLHIEKLVKQFDVRLGAFGQTQARVQALSDVTFDILEGETLSLVGESGCGKSTAGFTILRLFEPTSGSVVYNGQDIAKLDDETMRKLRKDLQVVFQDPYATLNPRMTVGDTIAEPIILHAGKCKADARVRVTEILSDVGLPERFANRYPHELSGGQRQRVAIARALACNPRFIVCDEAISALDVSVQAQIINLLRDLQDKYGLTYLFIAHDLAVVRHISDRVAVMYLGKLAELADKATLFGRPRHPYTKALLSAVPEANPVTERMRKRQILVGEVPSPMNPPAGCRFHTRCPIARDHCKSAVPEWREISSSHHVACHAVGVEGWET